LLTGYSEVPTLACSEALDWERARADVRPFLERERDIAMVTAEALGSLLDASAQRLGNTEGQP
jgi:hypothetical protein